MTNMTTEEKIQNGGSENRLNKTTFIRSIFDLVIVAAAETTITSDPR